MIEESVDGKLAALIDVIEGGYQFLLAYAAQGRHSDQGIGGGQSPRATLEAMAAALAVLPGLAMEKSNAGSAGNHSQFEAFFSALERDAKVAAAAINLVLARPHISSQLVDNLNASIHLRALLTDIFLVDEALES